MSGDEFLAVSLEACEGRGVSDIQFRAKRPVYIETNHGMECLDFLGFLSDRDLVEVYKALVRRQENRVMALAKTIPGVSRTIRWHAHSSAFRKPG